VNLSPFKLFNKLDNVKLSDTNVMVDAYVRFKLRPIGKVVLDCSVKYQNNINVTFLIINLDLELVLG
jgi:hypothetical protein